MAPTANPLVWFITGSSAGLGAALALQVLKSGHKVIAAARNITTAAKANPEIASLGGHWVTLDVTSLTSGSVIEEAAKIFGRIDVLVNNAGYSILGATEDITWVGPFFDSGVAFFVLTYCTVKKKHKPSSPPISSVPFA
jgi:NADP-dependent 3-hydroxy acid dehydrogenase YdfG